jgi:hypothetical protein
MNMNKIIFALLICVSLPANAIVSVMNLSDEPQSFNVSESTNETHIITVQPQRTWQTYAQQITIAPVAQPENQRIGRTWDTFAYWPDGNFSIQFRRRRHGRH